VGWSPPAERPQGWDGNAAGRVAEILLAAVRPAVEPAASTERR
jgi:hypothetical protein